ncbi:MAG: LCP family protein, partial [Lachnospiraceae bacterium]|nr:LCP family protein [Lachnospiraceae bacterium]
MSKKRKKHHSSGKVNNVENPAGNAQDPAVTPAEEDNVKTGSDKSSWLEMAKETKNEIEEAKRAEEDLFAEISRNVEKAADEPENSPGSEIETDVKRILSEDDDDILEELSEDILDDGPVEKEEDNEDTDTSDPEGDDKEGKEEGSFAPAAPAKEKGVSFFGKVKDYFKNLDEERKEKLIKNTGYCLCGFFLISIIILVVMVSVTGFVPGLYISLFAIAFLLLAGLFAILQEWFVPGMVGKILAVFFGVMFIVISVYLGKTYGAVKNITGIDIQKSTICVYSLKEAHISELGDTNNLKYGILEDTDRENTNKVMSEISLKIDFEAYGYPTVVSLVNALKTGEVDAIILNSAYLSIASGIEELHGITEELNSLYEVSVEKRVIGNEELTLPPMVISSTPVPTPTPSEPEPTLAPGVTATPTPTDTPTPTPYTGLAYTFDGMLVDKSNWVYGNKNVFTAYLSGIDTFGPPNTASRSDVNILCVVNMDTHRILMISTPRDYYVVLSGANMRDKLTHAGAYGIQTSINTLQSLYGVSIDYYAKVNFTGFMRVIDSLGGVDVNSEYEFFEFTKGINHMNGEAALRFARERYSLPGGDRARGKNQMAVINAIIKKLVSTDALLNFDSLLSSVSDCVATNMQYARLSELVRNQIGYGGGWDIVSYSVNGSDGWDLCYALGGSNYVMIPDMKTLEAGRQKIRNMYYK